MRKCSFALFLLGILMVFVACQQEFDYDWDIESPSLKTNEENISKLKTRTIANSHGEFMPLDSIPQWVKEKTTDEEFQLWKIMSTRYEINYSILDIDLREDQKADLYNSLTVICQKIREGSLGEGNLGYFVVQIWNRNPVNNIERLSRAEADGEKGPYNSYPEIIYRADEVSYGYVRVVATFYTNSEGNKIVRVGGAMAYADGDNAESFEGTCTTGEFGPLTLNVKCSGTLKFKPGSSYATSVSFNKSLNIKVLPG